MPNIPEPSSSPFWNPKNVVIREFPELISDSWYVRELCKGIAEGLEPRDWQRIYRVFKAGLQTFIENNGFEINGLIEAFQVGLHMGHAMRKEMFGDLP